MSNILEKLESLSKSATASPWRNSTKCIFPQNNTEKCFCCASVEDAELIAEMRNNIELLIEIARASHEVCKTIEFVKINGPSIFSDILRGYFVMCEDEKLRNLLDRIGFGNE